MDLRLFFAVPLIFLMGCEGNLPSGPILDVKINYHKEVLSNGLTVLMVENPSVPVISYQSWYKVGSIDESAETLGISHLFEHLMFKGTEKFGARSFFDELEMKGAEVNAFTTRDHTVFYQTFPSSLLPKVVEMEADRLQNLRLNEDVLNIERAVVLEERRLKTDSSPSARLQEELWKLSFNRHPYRWPVVGYPETLMLLSVENLNIWFKKYYQPSNLVLSIAGDFNRTELMGLIRKFYGKIPKGSKNDRKIQREPEQLGERRLKIHDEVQSPRVIIGYPISSANDDDTYSLDVLSNILFSGNSSRAHVRLVETENLLFGVNGLAYTPADPGLFVMTMALRPGIEPETAEKSLDGLLKEVKTKKVSQEDIRIAVQQLTVQTLDSIRNPYGIAHLMGIVETTLGRSERYSEDLAKYLKVTPESVLQVAEKYFNPNNKNVVTLLPREKKP